MVGDLEDLIKEFALEKLIEYSFKDQVLRKRAITRKAWVEELGPGNEIANPGLATLGDSVVGLAVVNHFYSMGYTPEQITDEKSSRVSRENHTKIATRIGLKDCLKLGKAEGNTKEWNGGSALGESLETVMGAVYLDDIQKGGNGLDVCTRVLKHMGLI